MNPEQRLASELLATLDDIKKEQLTVAKDAPLVYKFRGDDDAERLGLSKNPNEQQKILKKLEELGAFEITELPISKDWPMFTKDDAPLLVREYELQINQDRFEELRANYSYQLPNKESDHTNPSNYNQNEVRLVKDGASLIIETPIEKVVICRLKTGLIPERLFASLLNNYSGRRVKAAELRNEVDGLSGLKDISEVIRQSGFNRELKHIFFKYCTSNEVELHNPVKVSKKELDSILSLNRSKP